jgi:hypothetical protein
MPVKYVSNVYLYVYEEDKIEKYSQAGMQRLEASDKALKQKQD